MHTNTICRIIAVSVCAILRSSITLSDVVDDQIKKLKDGDPNVRLTAARTLGETKDARAAEALVAALPHNQPDVQHEVQTALVAIGEPAVKPLTTMLRRGNTEGWCAATVLIQIGKPSVTSTVSVLVESDFMGHTYAELTLTKIGAPSVGPLVLALENATRGKVPQFAPQEEGHVWKIARVLWKIGPPSVDPMLIALTNENPRLREAATVVLGNVKDQRTISPLITTLKDPNNRVRSAGMQALANFGEIAVDPLIRELEDEDPTARSMAASALVAIGLPSIKPLEIAMKGTNANLRMEGARVFQYMKNNKGTVPEGKASKTTE